MAVAHLSLGLVWAVVLVGSTAYASYRAAWMLVGPGRSVLRWAATPVIGCWLATVGFHALLGLGLFHPLPASVAAVALALASRLGPLDASSRRLVARDLRHLSHLRSELKSGSSGSRTWLMAIGLLPLVAVRLVRCLFQPPLGWDSLAYHGPRAASFVQEGLFTFNPGPGTWGMYRNFFAGAEVLWAWAMLPFHNDMWVGLASGLQWLGVGLATWAFGRSLGLREPSAGLGGLTVLFVPVLLVEVPSGYVELPLYMALMLALAAAVHSLRDPRPGTLLLAALAGGVTAGIKLPGALPAAVACACIFAVALRRLPSHQRSSAVALGMLATLLPALPWIAHAWVDTGAPLSPMPIRIFGLTLGVANPHFQWFLQQDVPAAYTWRGELGLLIAMFAPPGRGEGVLGLWFFLPVLLSPLGIARLFRSSRIVALMLVAVTGSILVFFYSPSFVLGRFYFPVSSSRYIAALVLMGVPLTLHAFDARPRGRRIVAGYLWGSAAFYALSYATVGWGSHEFLQVGLGGLAAAALVFAAAASWRWLAGRSAALAWGALLAIGLLATVGVRASQLAHRDDALRDSIQVHTSPRYWLGAAGLLDQPGESKRIAVTAGSSQRVAYWFAYYLYGSELQNRLRYVPVTAGGEIAHFGPGGNRLARANRAAWLDRIREGGFTHVFSFRPASLELRWMRRDSERFEFLQGEEDWGVFRVRATPEAATRVRE